MKKLILLALAAVTMAGCTERNEDGSIKIKPKFEHTGDCWIEIIDSCEYILWEAKLTHKGNCKYCSERRKLEMKQLVEQLKEK